MWSGVETIKCNILPCWRVPGTWFRTVCATDTPGTESATKKAGHPFTHQPSRPLLNINRWTITKPASLNASSQARLVSSALTPRRYKFLNCCIEISIIVVYLSLYHFNDITLHVFNMIQDTSYCVVIIKKDFCLQKYRFVFTISVIVYICLLLNNV